MNLHTDTMDNQEMAIGHIGWKYYNSIKKKAMEQEFSWSGLFLSLSIAFFVVIVSALLLSWFYESFQTTTAINSIYEHNFYRLEATSVNTIENYINTDHIETSRLILESTSEIV